jgi:hypothetical protein
LVVDEFERQPASFSGTVAGQTMGSGQPAQTKASTSGAKVLGMTA